MKRSLSVFHSTRLWQKKGVLQSKSSTLGDSLIPCADSELIQPILARSLGIQSRLPGALLFSVCRAWRGLMLDPAFVCRLKSTILEATYWNL